MGLPLKLNELQAKGWKVVDDNLKVVVPNVALTLTSKTCIDKSQGNRHDTWAISRRTIKQMIAVGLLCYNIKII